ncbi:MAG: AraC family transcriptional regulator [Bacteroidales bacterium]|nr:AraC family transcriptional regulator [Bacteroidales bacterium]
MKINIKNMVCPRCIAAVSAILVSEGLSVKEVNLGDVEIAEELSAEQLSSLARALEEIGFELLDDPRSQLVEQIRVKVLEWVRMEGDRPKLSDFLCGYLAKDYSTLSKLFSEVKGMTIERFAILHRIEYAKELLCYSQLSTSEIAYMLGYSSPAHLSSQFKQMTGMTPKTFRLQNRHDRISLDKL